MSATSPSFRFMTYNTHLFGTSWAFYVPGATQDHDARLRQMALCLEQERFDFVGMQEVFDTRYLTQLKKINGIHTLYAKLKQNLAPPNKGSFS